MFNKQALCYGDYTTFRGKFLFCYINAHTGTFVGPVQIIHLFSLWIIVRVQSFTQFFYVLSPINKLIKIVVFDGGSSVVQRWNDSMRPSSCSFSTTLMQQFLILIFFHWTVLYCCCHSVAPPSAWYRLCYQMAPLAVVTGSRPWRPASQPERPILVRIPRL